MVMVLVPVCINPVVMLSVGTLILLLSWTMIDEDVLLSVSILKVVTPVMDDALLPVSVTVLVPAVNVPELVQLPFNVWLKLPALKVVPVEMVISPLVVMAPVAVLVFPLDTVR